MRLTRDFRAALFDLDGVVTRTARVHAAAWKRLFDGWLSERSHRTGEPFHPFTAEDYRAYVDGRPRLEGIRTFLASRHLPLPEGSPEDGPEQDTLHGLARRKNAWFHEALREQGADVDSAAVALLGRLRAAGIGTAGVSASRNCSAVLEAAGLLGAFDVQVDGVEAARRGLRGKPQPDTFLEAARRLGVEPARAVVLEDARAGVEAGRRGGFGLVIGVRRAGAPGSLVAAGADVEVEGLGELAVEGTEPRERPLSTVPLVLERSGEVQRQLEGRRLGIFLDYDGTLTPIVPQPEQALLSAPMRQALAALSRRYPVAVVSGRDLAVLKAFVQLDSVAYAGSHGFDIEVPGGVPGGGPGGRRLQHPEALALLPELEAAAEALAQGVRGIEGARLERKRFSVAVHWRHVAPEQVPAVGAVLEAVLRGHPRLRKGLGKRVYEVQPDIDWGKGRAVQWLWRALGLVGQQALPVYVGDDLTDEDAFGALSGWGLGLVVRGEVERPTWAHWALRDTEEVRRLLEWLGGRHGEYEESKEESKGVGDESLGLHL